MVPSAGISMDQRIRNLTREQGHLELLVNVTDAKSEPKLFDVLRKLHGERQTISEAIVRTVVKNIKVMAQMGVQMEQYVKGRYPEFPMPNSGANWENYVARLSESLQMLMEIYGGTTDSQRTN